MHDCKKCDKPNCCGKDGGKCCHLPNDKGTVTTDDKKKTYSK